VQVAYSVPLYEERGIYLVQSKDQGKTWSDPHQVFDGAAGGFDVVGAPSLSAAGGSVHVLWDKQAISLDGLVTSLGLYYARSEDAGLAFSEASLVVEAPVAWREMAADGQGNLHRLWWRPDVTSTLWDQVSADGGRSWQIPQRLPAEAGLATVTADPAGRLHLVGLGLDPLGHWLWDGDRWQVEPALRWPAGTQPENEAPAELLAVAVSQTGHMVVLMVRPAGEENPDERRLDFAVRALDLPRSQPATKVAPTPAPTDTATPAPTAAPASATSAPATEVTPAATATREAASVQPAAVLPGAGTALAQIPRALWPVALLLLAVLGLAVLQAIGAKSR
jgi:hypothetical protein